MARATRSKAVINISEDQTASPISSEHSQAFHFHTNHLAGTPNTNPTFTTQDPMAAELKGLKAAYRTAIGGGRKGPKRGRKPNQIQLDSNIDGKEGAQEEAEDLVAQLDANPLPEAANAILKSPEGSLSTYSERLAIHNPTETSDKQQRFEASLEQAPVPERRTTRRQAAMAQAAEQALSQLSIEDVKRAESTVEVGGPTTSSQVLAKKRATSKEDMVAKEEFAAESKTQKKCKTSITSPIKSPVKTLDDIVKCIPLDKSNAGSDAEDDSFVEQILTRSPSKPVSRIEDSVEALDQLEEALEALDEAALAERLVSPEKTRQTPKEVSGPADSVKRSLGIKRARVQENTFQPTPTRSQSAKTGASSLRIKPTGPNASVVRKAVSMIFRSRTPIEPETKANLQPQPRPKVIAGKRPMSMIVKRTDTAEKPEFEQVAKAPPKRPISLLPPKDTVKSSKPLTKAAFELPGEAISRKIKEQREARLARKEASEESVLITRAVSGPQVKSTKPLTVSNFELPGEALSRRKREALEARLQAQEEEERKRREFKARPLPKNIGPNVVPRETVANRARQSRIGLENMIEGGIANRNSVVSTVGAHRAQAIAANVSAPRSPGPAPTLSRKPSTISASSISTSGRAMQRTVSATEVQVQRQRAKELYDRDAKLTEEIDRERRVRETAARKAREDAAERGRQASREWAEKQFARKMAEGDKGLTAGYGAGGQLGLKA